MVIKYALNAFRRINEVFGKTVTFIFQRYIPNKNNPKKSIRETSSVEVKCLLHYVGREEGVEAPAGSLDVAKIKVTVLKDVADEYNLYEASFIKFEEKLFKIKQWLPAIGFTTPADRIYFIAELSQEGL